jgi:LCP family protein required for cell wall assembly
VFFALLAVISAIGYGVYIASIVAKISTNPFDLTPLASDENGRVNVLVLGVGDPGHAGEGLSDTIMVMSLNTKTHRVVEVSVPRDLRVSIPGYATGKINQANEDGGPKLAEQTVSNTLNIPINYYVKSDFSGMKELVDAVGGIDVNVTQRLYDPEYPCDYDQYKVCGLDIEPGMQHMDGTKVLEYVRCRKGTCGDDFGRAARQQEVINLVRKKVVNWSVLLNPSKLTPIVEAVRNGIETDMGSAQMLQFARGWQQGQQNQPVTFVPSIQNGYLTSAGASDLVPVDGDFTRLQQHVQDIFTGGSSAGD